MSVSEAPPWQAQLARIDELIRGLERLSSPQQQAEVRELVQTLLSLHRAGLERMLEIVHDSGAPGVAAIDEMGRDDLVSHLLLLHDLHPLALESRIAGALESVQPRLHLHGGSVELLEVTAEGTVRLRLTGNCHGCPSSQLTLRSTIEEALYAAAPDLVSLEVEGAAHSPAGADSAAPPRFTTCPSAAGYAAASSLEPLARL